MNRCREMLNNLEKSVSGLPRGAINERKKRYKDKVYSYYYLKYREGEKVYSKHISENKIQELSKKLELRKKYEKEIQAYKKKIAYLNKIMGRQKRRGNAGRD
jgi:hypothetical protein